MSTRTISVLLACAIWLCCQTATCQTNADSLKNRIHRADLAEKVSICNKLCSYYQYVNPDSALHYAMKAKALARGNAKDLLAKAWMSMGKAHGAQGNLDSSLFYLAKAYQLAKTEGSVQTRIKCAFALGNYYSEHADRKESTTYYLDAEELAESIGDTFNIAMAMMGLGNEFFSQSQNEKAIHAYEKGYRLLKIISHPYQSWLINNLGNAYLGINKYDSALWAYRLSAAYKRADDDSIGLASSLNNIGLVYNEIDVPDSALIYLRRAYLIKNKAGYDRTQMGSTCVGLAFALIAMDSLDAALPFIRQAEKAIHSLDLLDKLDELYDVWINYYKAKGEYDKMPPYFDSLIQIRDSIWNRETAQITNELNTKYETKQKELALVRKDADLNKVRGQERQKTIMLITSLSVLTIVLIFGWLLFQRLRLIRRQKQIIETQKLVVEEKNQEITDSINYARRIQSAILPPQKLVKEYLQDSFVLYKPKDIVAGDFYWMEPTPDPSHREGRAALLEGRKEVLPHGEDIGGAILFAAADCTGHGVPGALVSVVCHNALNRAVREGGLTDPGKILDKARELVVAEFEKSEEDVKDGMDISLCSLSLCPVGESTGKLLWAGANNPLWLIREGELLEWKPDKQPIGKYVEPRPFTTHTVALKSGDSIYIFTDGFADQFGGPKGKKFKYKPFKKLLLSIQDQTMAQQRETIEQAFDLWKGNLNQVDDVCLIGVRV